MIIVVVSAEGVVVGVVLNVAVVMIGIGESFDEL